MIFLGLFAGQISTSMERASSGMPIESLADLSMTDVVCTPSQVYLSQLEKYPFKHYVAVPLSTCMEDLVLGKATAVYFDTPMLKYQFVVSPDLNTQFHTVSGTAPFFSLGPVYAASKFTSSRVLEIKRRLNIATLEVQQTSAFLDLYNTWYPSSRPSSGASNREDARLNLYLCVPATCFIVMYWGICVVIYFRDRAREGGWPCRPRNNGKSKTEQEKHEVPQEEEEGNSNTIEMGVDPGSAIHLDLHEENAVNPAGDSFMSKRKTSFMRRDGELKVVHLASISFSLEKRPLGKVPSTV